MKEIRRGAGSFGPFVVALIAGFGAYAASAAGPGGTPSWTQSSWASVAALVAGILAFGTAKAGGYVWRRSYANPATTQQFLDQQRYSRRRWMLDRVSWQISGQLDQSLGVMARLELGLKWQPEAVGNRPRPKFYRPDGQVRPVRPGERISVVFNDAGKALLILGAPGSGKTTLLLELTRELLHRAESDAADPIPVVFNLSSWSVRRPLADWLVDDLAQAYGVNRRLGREWVHTGQILPLLDGLDEVAVEHRGGCVEAINAFRNEHGLLPIAVCSGTAEHSDLKVRLGLSGAVEVQPLTEQQVTTYLEEIGEPLAGVRAALEDDPAFRNLLKTPLLLRIVTLAYHGKSVAPLSGTPEQKCQQIFTVYVDEMFERRGRESRYPKHKTVYWLACIARLLEQDNQSEFYLDRIQRDWLPTRAQQRMVAIASALLFALLVGPLSFGLAVGLLGPSAVGIGGFDFKVVLFVLLAGPSAGFFYSLGAFCRPQQLAARLRWSWSVARNRFGSTLFAGLLFAVLFFGFFTVREGPFNAPSIKVVIVVFGGLIALLLAALLNGLSPRTGPVERSSGSTWAAVLAALCYGLLAGLLRLGLGVVASSEVHRALIDGLYYGVLFGALTGLFVWLGERAGALQLVAHSSWSWAMVRGRLGSMLLVAVIAGLLVGASVGLGFVPITGSDSTTGVAIGLLCGLVFGLLVGFFYGCMSGNLDPRGTVFDDGTRRSAWISGFVGLVVALLVSLVFGPVIAGVLASVPFEDWLLQGLVGGLGLGFLCGLIAGLSHGLGERSAAIHFAEELRWSWSAMRTRLRLTVLVGLFAGLLNGLISVVLAQGLWALVRSLNLGLFVVLLVGLFSGLSTRQLDTPKVVPNEGIRQSARTAVLVGLGVGLLFGLFFGLPSAGLLTGACVGLVAGITTGLFFGGMACLQHLLLRIALVQSGIAPRHYVRFLDYAAELLFLRRVGGGYVFVHRLLLEYFSMDAIGGNTLGRVDRP